MRALAIVLLAACVALRAQSQGALRAYHSDRLVRGTVRIWGHGALGHDFMETLVKDWESGFRAVQRGVIFETRLQGTASAIGALYTGSGDLAIMGREIRPFEIEAFREVLHYTPLGIEVATGSFDVRNKDFALGIFVNRDNPLSKLTLAQVQGVFGCERGREIRKWGDLGLAGEWANRPIHLYGYQIWRGFADFFRDAVLAGSHRWNPSLLEILPAKASDGSDIDDGDVMLERLSKDRDGIAYCGMHYHNTIVRPLDLAVNARGPFYAPTKENCIQRTYPLTRVIVGFINRPPGGPPPEAVAEFLRYILSRDGQASVLREGDYLPLNAGVVREQRRKLE
jgi:phosphate transport system substrate-binding protein